MGVRSELARGRGLYLLHVAVRSQLARRLKTALAVRKRVGKSHGIYVHRWKCKARRRYMSVLVRDEMDRRLSLLWSNRNNCLMLRNPACALVVVYINT